ncbi:MAG: sigma-70 family RNA polymerase sigma factor [Myxococcaceae bacterium]
MESAAATQFVERAYQGHPAFPREDASFYAHVMERVPPQPDWDALHASDLLLAFAALRGHSAALTELDQRIVTATHAAVTQLRASPSFGEDVQQLLRQKLLLMPGAKLLDYAGRGPLTLWLRVAAMRVALNLIDAEKPRAQVDHGALGTLRANAPGPESVAEHRRFEPQFKAAMEEALAALSTRERNYLRLYFIEGLTVEAIARMEGANKSTVSRWLTRSKETLLEDVRKILETKLALAPQDLDSLLGDMQSQLDVSLVRILG